MAKERHCFSWADCERLRRSPFPSAPDAPRGDPMKLRIVPALVMLGLTVATVAHAQSASQGEFTVQRFQPAPGPHNLITVEGARIEGKMAFSLGLVGNYASDPFLVRSCHSATDCSNPNASNPQDIHVIRDLVTID